MLCQVGAADVAARNVVGSCCETERSWKEEDEEEKDEE